MDKTTNILVIGAGPYSRESLLQSLRYYKW